MGTTIYLISLLSSLSILLGVCLACIGTVYIILIVNEASEYDGDVTNTITSKFSKWMYVISFVLATILVCIPSKSDMYLIFGLNKIEDIIVSQPGLQEIPEKSIEAFNILLDNYIKDIKKE